MTDALRARLVTLRAGARERLADGDASDTIARHRPGQRVDPRRTAEAAARMTDVANLIERAERGEPGAVRAVVADDGREIMLTVYGGTNAIGALALSPLRAISIANELIDAGLRHLSGSFEGAGPHAQTKSPRLRGGDRRAEMRAERDAALRALHRLRDDAQPLGRLARDLRGQLARYQPMAEETSPERILMRQVLDSGLPVPSAERIRKILRAGQAKNPIG